MTTTKSTVRQYVARMLRYTRANNRLIGIGVECRHYQHRWYVRGNTYQFRELLKEMGFRWDAGSRGWYTLDVDLTCEFMCRACRQMDQAYRAA